MTMTMTTTPTTNESEVVGMSRLQQVVKFYPAYDKRHTDPRKNYGIHGVDLRMLVIGDKGAIQFVLYTNWQLPHVQAEEDSRPIRVDYPHLLCRPMPADLGYHAKVPQYEGQEPLEQDCEWTGGVCYYDGSGLNAEPVYVTLLEQGSDGVWERLEREYRERFE